MSLLSNFIKWVVQKFWPWFVEYVWPFIKEYVLDLLRFCLKKLSDLFKSSFSEKQDQRFEEADAKAKQADHKAYQSNSEDEANKYRAIADIWREVAEQYRRDKEDLQRELDRQTEAVHAFSIESVDRMDIKADFSESHTIIKINETARTLPTLQM